MASRRRNWAAFPSWCGVLLLVAGAASVQAQTLGKPTSERPTPALPDLLPHPVATPVDGPTARVDPFPVRTFLPPPTPPVNAVPEAQSFPVLRPVPTYQPVAHSQAADKVAGPQAKPPTAEWALSQLVELAAQNHPDLAVARARVQAAEGRLVQAGLYPNPVLTYRHQELNNREDRLGEIGGIFMQEFVTMGKLRIAQAAASFGIEAADWQTTTRWFDVLTRVRQAYFETLTAQRNLEAAEKIVDLARKSLAAAQQLEKVKIGSQLDILRAQVEVDQNLNRLVAAQRRLDAAWQLLAVAVGVPD